MGLAEFHFVIWRRALEHCDGRKCPRTALGDLPGFSQELEKGAFDLFIVVAIFLFPKTITLRICLEGWPLLLASRQPLSLSEDSLTACLLTLLPTVTVNYELPLEEQRDFLSPSSCPGWDLIPP